MLATKPTMDTVKTTVVSRFPGVMASETAVLVTLSTMMIPLPVMTAARTVTLPMTPMSAMAPASSFTKVVFHLSVMVLRTAKVMSSVPLVVPVQGTMVPT